MARRDKQGAPDWVQEQVRNPAKSAAKKAKKSKTKSKKVKDDEENV